MAFDETVDWVVIGSGAGSMTSALVMRTAGKSVLILEKSAFIGGTTAKSGGVIWVPNNRFMKADGEQDSVEAGITYLDAACEDLPGSGHDKRLAYVNQAYRMIDFLVDSGVELERGSAFWPDYYDELPGGCKTSRTVVAKPFDKKELGKWAKRLRKGFLEVPVKLDDGMKLAYERLDPAVAKAKRRLILKTIWSRLTGKQFVTAGAALQGRMLKASLAAGVELRTATAVSELVAENGAVTGVVAGGRRIGARLGVLVNAGGFAQNQAMRDTHMPGTQASWSLANEGDMGELHTEMARVGGVLAQMDQMVGYQTTLSPGWERAYITPPAQSLTGKPHAILVDQSGVRYMNEGGSYELFCQTMIERNRTVPAVPSWAILDRTYVERYQVAQTFIDKAVPKGWVEAGYLHMADTIEQLATSIGTDPATLSATVDRWNGFVAQGRDEDFHRGERAYDTWLGDPYHGPVAALGAIERGPFYAVPVVPGDVSTYGGAVTDVYGRVTDATGTPILGLYATGVSSASVMGGVYPGAGSSIGPSMTFGYVAAKHAAGLDNQV
ncbi:FAD-dependent oxidoreductase [Sphingomonas ginsenosidivorax]|uniref:FAD-dependent oxidoreductase n=1 Tax=Sphingomonas ginsenosidivorax TaxID=862135 RepID=A0A5C6UBW3_9SPHN|nr:FAD-dependent oxidoreductase [Sphingomonas ginsenosidivorax]TXC70273.1 FAD-dependent oxidoreductase [Sphingomonas ginsenosidivorax]